jgi:phage repressor protein C with HTH and peptisase S24 domain
MCFGVSSTWLLEGKGAMFTGNKVDKPADTPDVGIVRVPVYSLAVSAGHGSIVDLEPFVTFTIPFESTLLRKRLSGASFKDLAIVEVVGDSMAPEIANGDMIMFDKTAATRPFRDGLWVFRLGEAIHVKHVQQVGPHQFEAHSVNPKYRTFTFDDEYQFIGLVVWSDRAW